MPTWFQETKDGDKIALLLLFTGVVLLILGTMAILAVILWLHDEGRVDRAIVAIGALGAQGSGLITAAMGVLRFQQKAPSNGTATTTTATTVTSEGSSQK